MVTHGPRRVVVSGVGAVCAAGADAASLWRAIVEGRSGIASHPGQHGPGAARGPAWPQARIAAAAFDGEALFGRDVAMLDRVSQLAIVAADEAMRQAGLRSTERTDHARSEKGFDAERAGAIFGASLGHHTLDDGYRHFYGSPPRPGLGSDPPAPPRLHPFLVPRGMPSAAASQLSMRYGLRGPSFATASACASSAHAIGLAFHCVRSGMLDLALSGGAEASLVPGMVRAWEGLRVLSPDGCRPFSRDRSGLVLGEGAAALVLESRDHALARGAVPIAEMLGLGMSADAGDITAPDPDGAARAMRAALADAGLSADAVDYVNAHGTGTRLNDPCEVRALRAVFGARVGDALLPVSSSKAQIGHCLNAAGALEALITVLALRDGVLPPTLGFREADAECAIDCVPNESRRRPIATAMSNSFAFGGLNAVLLFGRAAA